jgi:nucleoredoxin
MTSTTTTGFLTQFGETLINPSNKHASLSPSDALAGKDQIMLYFSAHWCPPCRRFTPKLIDFYKKIKETKNIELVFCSLDNDEKEYNEYTEDMPWLCLPFDAKESKLLASKYEANGIPHLVVVDGTSGEVITMDGTAEVQSDESGEKFPWKPKSFGEVWPSKILASGGEDFLESSTFKDKYLMLYFSAHWCPPCRQFTPTLSEAYKKLKSERDDFELVFVSSDRDENSFKEYFADMSFCGLPFEDRDTKSALSKMFGIQGLPTLIILGKEDEAGNRALINSNLRGIIDGGDFSDFPFHKKNYGSAESVGSELNDTKSLIIFHESGDDEEQREIKDVAKEVAGKVEDKNMNVLWVLSSTGLTDRVRELVKLPESSKADKAAMVLLDLPDNGGYYKTDVTDISVESVMNFIESPGDRLQLK